jgi:pimeloyl-ACP methyl ester carboxylesterase
MQRVARYAKSGDIHVAYQVFGEGPNLVMVPGFVSHFEYSWDEPRLARWLNKLGGFCRVILFDKRGTGLSDRIAHLPHMDERMDDLRAVMDAVGVGRASLLGVSEGKARIMHWARCLSRRTEPGRAYGVVTAKALAVLEALLWGFHHARSGLCFPSYETIAEAAGCARSTVAEAVKALEVAGMRRPYSPSLRLCPLAETITLRVLAGNFDFLGEEPLDRSGEPHSSATQLVARVRGRRPTPTPLCRLPHQRGHRQAINALLRAQSAVLRARHSLLIQPPTATMIAITAMRRIPSSTVYSMSAAPSSSFLNRFKIGLSLLNMLISLRITRFLSLIFCSNEPHLTAA